MQPILPITVPVKDSKVLPVNVTVTVTDSLGVSEVFNYLVVSGIQCTQKQKLFSDINFNISVVNYFPCYEHKARVSARHLLKYATMNTFFLLHEKPLLLTQILPS